MKTGIDVGLLGQGLVRDRARVHGKGQGRVNRLVLEHDMEQEQGRRHYYKDSHRENDLHFVPRVEDHPLSCHFQL